jgi:predicted Fe-Mo cluster-binding NifX family protein
MKNYRIAVSTKGKDGLEDLVSDVFGKANTFTIVDVINEKMDLVKVIENPAKSYTHGSGPIVVKMLIGVGVELVLAYQLGLGAQGLLKQNNIEHISVMPKTKVREAVELAIHSLKKEEVMYEI